MGYTLLFCIFVSKPEASPKSCSRSRVIIIYKGEGYRKVTICEHTTEYGVAEPLKRGATRYHHPLP
jgi:hypothetical protein